MSCKVKITQFTYVFLFIAIVSIFCCCAPKDPADIASKLAQDWASSNINSISRSIAGLVSKNNPLIETAVTMAIDNQINKKIVWVYSEPQKLAEGHYSVMATAYSPIELHLLGNYRISINYKLEIDTKLEKVIAANIDAGYFAMTNQ